MRISTMRDVLEKTAIDHVYYRAYDPMVRCVGREYTPTRAAQIAMLVATGAANKEIGRQLARWARGPADGAAGQDLP